jgi:hypothetical protein
MGSGHALQVFLLSLSRESSVRWWRTGSPLGAAVQNQEPLIAERDKEHAVLGLAAQPESEYRRSWPTISHMRHAKLGPKRAQDFESAGGSPRLLSREAIEPILHRSPAVYRPIEFQRPTHGKGDHSTAEEVPWANRAKLG